MSTLVPISTRVVRTLIALTLVTLAALQAKLWFGDTGQRERAELSREVDVQRDKVAVLAQQNRLLTNEVVALSDGLEGIESRARTELGMVKPGETLYLLPASD